MPRSVEQPVTKSADRGGTVTSHPAFGQIVAHRVSGHSILYGSDFVHNATMRITISRSEQHRDLSHDWHFSKGEIIEVELSEAQWATFVSAPNIGSGPPCTIRHLHGTLVPALPDPIDRSDQFAREMSGKMSASVDALNSLLARIDEMGMPKGKTAELRAALNSTIREITANLPFVAETFGRHVENTVEKAKQEIHGYMQGVISRAGIASLQNSALPLQIDNEGRE